MIKDPSVQFLGTMARSAFAGTDKVDETEQTDIIWA